MDNLLFHGDTVDSNRILYTPSNFAKNSLLHIQEIGTLQAQRLHESKRTRLQSFLFFTVNSGSGTLNYCGVKYELAAGDCVFIDCTKPYSHKTSSDLWSLSWIHLYGPTVPEIYEKYVQRGGLPSFHPVDFAKYKHALNDLYVIATSESYVRDMKINVGLANLLTYLMEDSWQAENVRPDAKKSNLLELKNYLDENYAKKISLDELAERYYINKYYLTRIFKEQFGASINNYLLSVRITKAKHDLRFTDKSTEEIGLESGIGNGYYFSRVFHKVEGISPSEYRKQWRS